MMFLFAFSNFQNNCKLKRSQKLIKTSKNLYEQANVKLGELNLNEFQILDFNTNQYITNVKIYYNNYSNYYVYDSIRKYHSLVYILELKKNNDKKYAIVDTILKGNLNDTLKFNIVKKNNSYFAISNESFTTILYEVDCCK